MRLIGCLAFIVPIIVGADDRTVRSKLLQKSVLEPESKGANDKDRQFTRLRLPFGNDLSSLVVARNRPELEIIVPDAAVTAKPKLVLTSKRSWVNDFMVYMRNKGRGHKLTQATSAIEPEARELLRSKIVNYEDLESDSQNLKHWTQNIVSQDDSQSPSNKYAHLTHLRELPSFDRHDFIRYLVDSKQFEATDLSFLQTRLDYGLAEIDQELSKIKEMEHQRQQQCISIGGENVATTINFNLLWVPLVMWLL